MYLLEEIKIFFSQVPQNVNYGLSTAERKPWPACIQRLIVRKESCVPPFIGGNSCVYPGNRLPLPYSPQPISGGNNLLDT